MVRLIRSHHKIRWEHKGDSGAMTFPTTPADVCKCCIFARNLRGLAQLVARAGVKTAQRVAAAALLQRGPNCESSAKENAANAALLHLDEYRRASMREQSRNLLE